MSQIDIIEKFVNHLKEQNSENKTVLNGIINKEKRKCEIVVLLFLVFVGYFLIFGFNF